MKIWPILSAFLQPIEQGAMEAAASIAQRAVDGVFASNPALSPFEAIIKSLLAGAEQFAAGAIHPNAAVVAVSHAVATRTGGNAADNLTRAAGSVANGLKPPESLNRPSATSGSAGAQGNTGASAASDIATKAVAAVRAANPAFNAMQLTSEALLHASHDFAAANIGHDEAVSAISKAVQRG